MAAFHLTNLAFGLPFLQGAEGSPCGCILHLTLSNLEGQWQAQGSAREAAFPLHLTGFCHDLHFGVCNGQLKCSD